jgi:hypothetical protein
MPRTFGASFITALAKTADRTQPAPKPVWTAVFRFPAPTGNLYFSTGRTITFGSNTYYGMVTKLGDLSSLIDRREPLRLDIRAGDLELSNIPAEEGPTEDNRVSSYFALDLEATQIDIGLAFDLGAGSYTHEVMFQGIAQAATVYGYRLAELPLVSVMQKYLGAQALRVLSDQVFPFIRSADNGKGVPLVFGNVRRAPGRVVKEKAWTEPKPDLANVTGQALSKVEVGSLAVSETVTITFSSTENYTVSGDVSGAMGTGSTLVDFTYPLNASSINRKLRITADSWTGAGNTGNVFTFDIDVTTISEIEFSESPVDTPIADLLQLYWNDYAIYDGLGIEQASYTGVLSNIGDKEDDSSTSGKNFDSPIVSINEVSYAVGISPIMTDFMLAGKYEYVQTYIANDEESKPTNAADIELKAEPLPEPANPPQIEYSDFVPPSGGGLNKVDKGTHRWAYSYVSQFGESPLGEPSGQFTVNKGEIPDPDTEPYLTYEGPGVLFLNGTESARAYCYTWINADGGETKPSPARSVQVLDVPGSVYGISLGVHPPSPKPEGAIAAKIYRTTYTGTTGDFTQLEETGTYHFLGQTGFDDWYRDNGSTVVGDVPPTENTTGQGSSILLSAIQPDPPPGTQKIRIYRTLAGDSGPFHFVAEFSAGQTTFTDFYTDAYISSQIASFIPVDPRNGQSPIIPYDTDLSADTTRMIGSVRVELPKVPVPEPHQFVQVKVYRSKRDKPGTHYYLTTRSGLTADLTISNDDFIDSTPDKDLGDGMAQTERPPAGGFGEQDRLTGIALRIVQTKSILAKQVGVMVGKVGNPPGDVTINIVGNQLNQPEGGGIISATIPAAEVVGFQLNKQVIAPTIIPAGIFWLTVDTTEADKDNYYYIGLGPTTPGMMRYAKSSLQNRWIPVGGTIVFDIEGAEFTLETAGIDAAGQQVARAIMDVEIPSDVIVSCDMSGLSDDGTGTYTGTAGALITNGADIAHWIGAELGGVPELSIDVAGTFAATKAKYGTLFKLNGVVQENTTVLELLLKLGLETRSIPDWSFDKLEWKWLPAGIDPPYTPYKIIHKGDLWLESNDPQSQPRVRIERFGLDGVINTIDLHWARKAWIDAGDPSAYARVTTGDDPAAVTKYGALARADLFNFDFVSDEETAIALVAFYLSRYGAPNKCLITVTLIMPFLDVEKDDIVKFDSTPSAYGGGTFGSGVFGGSTLYDGLIPEGIYQVEGKKLVPSELMLELTLREL